MKKNIIFALKCILVLAPLIFIILYAALFMPRYIKGEAIYFLWNKQVCSDKNSTDYDVIILGDSIANSDYMPEILSDSAINLSLGGATPMENYYTLCDYLENHDTPKSVYMSYNDSHFEEDECFWPRTMYSHRYSVSDNVEMFRTACTFSDESITADHSSWDFISYQLYLPNKYIKSIINAKFGGRYENNKNNLANDEIHRGRYMATGIRETTDKPEHYEEFRVQPLFDYYYRESIKLCLEKGIKVHLVKLPLPNDDRFDEEYFISLDNFYDGIREEFPEVTVDFWDTYEPWYFADFKHMNNHGAFRFSRELKAKYPDEFNNEFSERQMAGIADSLKQENYFSEIIEWVNACSALSLNISGKNGETITSIEQGCSVTVQNDTVSIVMADGSEHLLKYDATLGIDIVIENLLDGSVICEKHFDEVDVKYNVISFGQSIQ